MALMEIQASRSRARVGPTGEPMLLLDQNRARWDQLLIRRGLAALDARRERWAARAGRTRCRPRSPPATRGRARRRRPTGRASRRSTTRSPSVAPSPVVELNRAVAVVDGVRAGGGARARRRARPPSRRSQATTCCRACAATCWPSSAALDEARAEFERAASLTRNARERELLLARAEALSRSGEPRRRPDVTSPTTGSATSRRTP